MFFRSFLKVCDLLKVEEYWQDIYGLNKNCTRYFQKYLLSDMKTPLVFAIT
ncbi:MAG: AAA-like domain-containing protein [Heteroscytonema crispum UTEX LB 1556]